MSLSGSLRCARKSGEGRAALHHAWCGRAGGSGKRVVTLASVFVSLSRSLSLLRRGASLTPVKVFSPILSLRI